MTDKQKDISSLRKEQFLKISKELAEQFYKKNKDYGDAYFNNLNKDFTFNIDKKLSELDFYINLRRKFARLASFAEKKLNNNSENLVNDETEEDTIRDVCIYSVMELMKRQNGKNK